MRGIHSRIIYKNEQSMIIWEIRFTLDFEIISLIPIRMLLKPHVGGHLPFSDIKIGKWNFQNNALVFISLI